MNVTRRLLAFAAVLVLAVVVSGPAQAEPWFGWGQTRTDDLYTSGDIDLEDLVQGPAAGLGRDATREVRAGSWVTVGSYFRSYEGKYQDVGVFLIAAVAFDRVAKGRLPHPTTGLAEGTAKGKSATPPETAPSPPPAPPTPVGAPSADAGEGPRLVVTPAVARKAVASAWRSSGLGVDDAKIESMVARARSSAALPETRVRAMRVFADATSSGIVPIDTSTYASAGNSVVLEARLTWRLDQLLYASDEPSLERVRLERRDARAKLATKVLDALFQWQRAWLVVQTAGPTTREATDASVRLVEAEAGLDVMTGGWFSAWAGSVQLRAWAEASPSAARAAPEP